MESLAHFSDLANRLHQEEPPEIHPIPFYARSHTGGYYVCAPGCGKLFTDIASKNRHQAQYCHSYRESDRSMSSQRLMGA